MQGKLFWIDLETTGLDPETDQILEVGCIVTDFALCELDRAHFIIKPEGSPKMDDFVRQMHTESGLLEECKGDEAVAVFVAQNRLIELAAKHADGKVRPYLAGNSVHFDRSFLAHSMPVLVSLLNYRQVDVSTLKVLNQAWSIQQWPAPAKKPHRSMEDLDESITELLFYRGQYFAP